MALSLVTAPATEPLSLAEAKAQLRVDTDDENDLILTLIGAAREYGETFTHRAFITQTWDLQLDGFPFQVLDTNSATGAIVIPKPPCTSVTSITYVDMQGVTQTWDPTLWTLDNPQGPKARPARIVPAYFQIYPVTRWVPNAATVRFKAGYGDASTVPFAIKAAMKLLIGNWWVNREAGQIVRGSADVLPFGVDPLLWAYKAF